MLTSPIARRFLVPLAAIGLVASSAVIATTATADHTPTPTTVAILEQ